MAELKTRKKTSKTAGRPSGAKKAKTKAAMKAKPANAKSTRTRARAPVAKKPVTPLPHPDETTVRLGPHHVDRHPTAAAFHVHPDPKLHPVGPLAMKHPRATLRHH